MSEDAAMTDPGRAGEPIPVLLLGTFHMANPGLDLANPVVDDVLTEQRQAELEELADRLAAFRPTKVAVEAPWDGTGVLDRYAAHRNEARPLRGDEIEQIGFRVAARAGHGQVWPIDVADVFFDPNIERVAGARPVLGRWYEAAQTAAARIAADQEAWLAEGSITDVLRRMNEPAALHAALALYVSYLTPVADPPAWPGPDMVAAWYRRNLRILSRLHAISGPGDRILVVFGQGHVALWNDLMTFDDAFVLAEAAPFFR